MCVLVCQCRFALRCDPVREIVRIQRGKRWPGCAFCFRRCRRCCLLLILEAARKM